MKTKIYAIATLMALALLTSVAGAERPELDPARGAKLYSDNCGRCHNARGSRLLPDRHWRAVVQHMRVIGGIPGDQARDIEAFLRASNNPPRREFVEGTAQRSGDELVIKYGCRGCHVIDGAGGTVGPSLDDVFSRRDEGWVREQIQRPREHNPNTVMPELGLTSAEVDAILETLRTP